MLGSEMTRSGKPVMVCGWMGELFPFTLSDSQARSVSLKTTGIVLNANRRCSKPAAKAGACHAVEVEDLPDSLDGNKPIKGTVKVTVVRPLKEFQNLRLRVDLKFPEFTQMKFFTPKAAIEDGASVAFTFSEINAPGAKSKPFQGPVAVFVNLVDGSEDDKPKLVVVSNTTGLSTWVINCPLGNHDEPRSQRKVFCVPESAAILALAIHS
ncbi:MAG: hypothetical protein U0792_16225 [Gemmataceae bacterium]